MLLTGTLVVHSNLGVSLAPNTPAAMQVAIQDQLLLYRRSAATANLKAE